MSDRLRLLFSTEYFHGALIVLITLGFFAIIFMMGFAVIPPTNKDALNIMVGALASAWSTGVSHFFKRDVPAKSVSNDPNSARNPQQ